MKFLFGENKKSFILMSCIAVALIASGIVIGVTVSQSFADKGGESTVASDEMGKKDTDAGSPDKSGSVAGADHGDASKENSGAVSLDGAKKAALADAGLNEADVTFTQTKQDKDNNIQVYDIEFSTSDKKYEYEISAADGSIIEKDVRTLNITQSSGPAASGSEDKYIGTDKAKEIALKDAKLSAADVKFTKSEIDTDGNVKIYDIEFTVSDKKYEYEINAVDGSIIETDIRPSSFVPDSGTVENSSVNQYIGLESAKETALKDANVGSSDVTFTKTRLDSDDNTPSYDIEFRTSDKKYDYEINATTGAVIEKDIETIRTQQTSTPSGNTSSSYIGVEKAKQIALSDANVSASNAAFTKTKLDSDDRTPKYDIEFRTSDKKYDYEINATTGAVIEKDIETVRTQQSSKASGNTDSNYIGTDRAKEIALNHAGLSESSVRFTKTELDRDNGRYEYEIEFVSGRTEYEYTIDAVSGKIIENDMDYDD